MNTHVERHPLLAFYLLAYAASWSVAVPLALQATGVIHTQLPLSLHYLTAYGPVLAAFVVSRIVGRESRSAETSGHGSNRWLWLAIGGLSPLALFILAQVGAAAMGQRLPGWRELGQVNFLPDLGLAAWLLWFVTSGLGEELGWRGYALPTLQRSHSALASSGLLAVAWAGWHLPAFFYVPSYAEIGFAILPGFFIGILAGSIVLTWLYNSSGGRVLSAVLWHASFNYVTASPNARGLAATVVSTGVIGWAAWIAWRYDRDTLTLPRARSVRPHADERLRALPGDELIPDANGSFTHAVTIRRGVRDVWRWLAQMGAGRAGWYSYDRLDNGGVASADRIRPELQSIDIGTVMPALPGARDGFIVTRLEPEHFLILTCPHPAGGYMVSWTFVLEPLGPDCTRLIARARGKPDYRFFRLPHFLSTWPARLVHFVMERKQLLGIAKRAEAAV